MTGERYGIITFGRYGLPSGHRDGNHRVSASHKRIYREPDFDCPGTGAQRGPFGLRFGDTAKGREQVGFVTDMTLHDGLPVTTAWTRANCEIVGRCMPQHARVVPGMRASLA